jgi:protein arginine kinase
MNTPPIFLPASFDRTAKWMRRGGQENDIVISSRVRLARNFRRFPFPHRAEIADLLRIRQRVFQALCDTVESPGGLRDARFLPFEEFTGWERQSLIDRHLTSREHVREEVGRGVAALADASVAVLINEEDHLRLQSLLPGLQLDAAHAVVDRLDDALEGHFDERSSFAWSEVFGYVTACPTNAGTGLRASVMLHLPALEIAGRLNQARRWTENKGLALRGTFGEGSKVWGHLHQISNQATLGLDETDILLEVEAAARELCGLERRAREELSDRFAVPARDRVGRAYGVLRYAHSLSCREATDCLSLLRLAHELGWAKGLPRRRFNELMVWIRPAYLQVLHGRSLPGEERDSLRADLLRPHIARLRLSAELSSADKGETPPRRDAAEQQQVVRQESDV